LKLQPHIASSLIWTNKQIRAICPWKSPNRVLKTRASRRDPALCGFCSGTPAAPASALLP
jgi:hypothetical protein